MSAPRPLEEARLAETRAILEQFTKSFPENQFESLLQALEASSSRLGGFDLADYQHVFDIHSVSKNRDDLARIGLRILASIEQSGIPPSLALSALARESLVESKRRNTGAYHTDFRLALYLARIGVEDLPDGACVIDPACGTGMLLAAVTQIVCGSDRRKATEWLRESVNAADLSQTSLRGALLALASFTSDIGALKKMRSRWLTQDSLFVESAKWAKVAPRGFDLVIGNPPWEKVKTTRHEFLKASGATRHYGALYTEFDAESYLREQAETSAYASAVAKRYACAQGEVDLYVPFLEMFLSITKEGGRTAALVPAGLIRSQRTETLRRLILSRSSKVTVSVLENRARFFKIDTRFKFLALTCHKSSLLPGRKMPLILSHAVGKAHGVAEKSTAIIGRAALEEVRSDFTIPEVRGNKEWALFLKMSRNGVKWDDPSEDWTADIVREVDMTRDRRHFRSEATGGLIPLVEGRMVQQHRFGAKSYLSGTGRSALWKPLPIGSSKVNPQFHIDVTQLSHKVVARTKITRAGFCDITGQTNERSLMAALIPPDVACGNKVPTIVFPADPSEERLLLWVGIVNSLPFDWLLRRVVTTTVNYFVLLGIPLPRIGKSSLPGRQIIEASRRLWNIDRSSGIGLGPEIGELRAGIDVTVAMAYGMNFFQLELMLHDFPLVDRGQPALPGELKSTITSDFVRLNAARRMRAPSKKIAARVSAALAAGAVPYVPAEHVLEDEEMELTSG